MAITIQPMTGPSGQALYLLARNSAVTDPHGHPDGAPVPIDHLSDQNEVHQLSVDPDGNLPAAVNYSIDGHATPDIPTTYRLPPSYGQFVGTLPQAGSFDIAIYVVAYSFNMTAATFEILDNNRVIGTVVLNLADPNVILGSSTFNDEAVYRNGTAPIPWVPLGRFTFGSTVLGVRVSGPAGNGNLQLELLRVGKADGSSHFHVLADAPPFLYVAGEGDGFRRVSDSYAGNASGGFYLTATGAGSKPSLNPALIQSALQSLSNIGAGNATVSGDGLPDSPCLIRYISTLARQAIDLIVPSDSSVIVTRYAAGNNWFKLRIARINGGAELRLGVDGELGDPYWGARVWDGPTDTQDPYLPFLASMFLQDSPDVEFLEMGIHRNFYHVYSNSLTPTRQFGTFVYGDDLDGSYASWTAEGRSPGQHRISFTWCPAGIGNPLTNSAAWTIATRDGEQLASGTINQRVDPSGAVDHGVPWAVAATVTTTEVSTDVVIRLTNTGTGILMADAVRVERISTDRTMTIVQGDTVTISAGPGAVITTAGPSAAMVDVPVEIRIGGTLYPPIGSGPRRMIGGFNTAEISANNGHWIYLNAANTADFTDDEIYGRVILDETDGHPVNFVGSPGNPNAVYRKEIVLGQVPHNSLPPCNMPAGPYSLFWDGPSIDDMEINDGELLSATSSGNSHHKIYNMVAKPGEHTPAVVLIWHAREEVSSGVYAVDAHNIRVIPHMDGVDPANPAKFMPGEVDKIRAINSTRWLQGLRANEATAGTVADFEPAQGWLGKSTPRAIRIPVVRVEGYDPSRWPDLPEILVDRSSYVPMEYTTGIPHGLPDGCTVALYGDLGTVTVSTGHTAPLNNIGRIQVYVLSDTVVLILTILDLPRDGSFRFVGAPISMTNVLTPAEGAGGFQVDRGNPIPFSDMIELCNQCNNGLGGPIYLNIPHTASDEALRWLGEYAGANLAAGQKIYVECANEPWNFNEPPFAYFYQRSVSMNLGGGWIPAYCITAKNQWDRFREGLAVHDRESDLIRVLGSQYGVTGVTGALCDFCQDHGIAFDAVTISPYVQNAGYAALYESSPEMAAIVRRMTFEQDMDLCEAMHTWGRLGDFPAGHRAYLDQHGLTNVKIVAYEASINSTVPSAPGFVPKAVRRLHYARAHPRMFGIVMNYMRNHEDYGFSGLWYFLLSASGQFGSDDGEVNWVSYDNTPLQLPGTGDAEQDPYNVTDPERMDLIKSQMGGAINAWSALVRAGDGSGDDGGGSGDGGSGGSGSGGAGAIHRTNERLLEWLRNL
jgi:hypothetical protein